MKHKLIGKTLTIGVLILFVGAALPMVTAETNEKITRPIGTDWSDNFDSYTLGQFLDGDPEDGGWEGWDGDPQWGSYVVDDQALSSPHSVEIVDASDTIHQFDITDGVWTCTAWQYIPSDFVGQSYFIMLNTYAHGGPNSWSTQLRFDSAIGQVESEFESAQLPLILDQWVEIRVEIDLIADTQDIYYGDILLSSKGWSTGVTGSGETWIQCIDLFANAASPVYYDDLSLVEETGPEDPVLEFSNIAGGIGVSADLGNTGAGDATDVEWTIAFDGGIVIPKEKTGTITTLAPDDSETIKAIVIGIGKPTITFSATCAEGVDANATASGFVLLFFVLGVS